ncbi:GroES-like protein [Dichomitus squalens LYAD-421 SS1]|uniref:GroES-like protein n=1 Tax=Dichomitus squalens (strain LYAD-421) TaxID=732165 RepID=R7SS16_DICSQ|nr:GroES-like protein [Dichomitus squalens LYAD-421 SS1]EJF58866.1 GroES-like protein [Dichomitus squalens LYAD-421 SS1]
MAPTTQKALVIPAAKAPFQLVADWPVTKPGPSDVLIKLVSVALNPADAWIKEFGAGPPLVPGYPFILGDDGAGVVEEVGPEVTNVAKGDRVLVVGGFNNDRAMFKEYLTYPAREVVKIPDNLSFDQAATVPLAFATAVTPIWASGEGANSVRFTPPWEEGGTTKYAGKPALVLGGSTSVGQFVIQLARLQGFSPIIATSSLRNAEFLKSIGATDVLDRSLSPADIKNALSSLTGGKPIEYVYDAWGRDRESARVGYSVLAPGGAFATVIPQELTDIADLVEESEKKGEGRRIGQAWATYDTPGNKELGEEIYKRLTGWLETGAIVPNRVEVLPNGLAGVETGLQRMLKGQVSGVKLVVHISETP